MTPFEQVRHDYSYESVRWMLLGLAAFCTWLLRLRGVDLEQERPVRARNDRQKCPRCGSLNTTPASSHEAFTCQNCGNAV